MTKKEREREREPHPLVHSSMLCQTGAEFPLGFSRSFPKGKEGCKGLLTQRCGAQGAHEFNKATSRTFIDSPR